MLKSIIYHFLFVKLFFGRIFHGHLLLSFATVLSDFQFYPGSYAGTFYTVEACEFGYGRAVTFRNRRESLSRTYGVGSRFAAAALAAA